MVHIEKACKQDLQQIKNLLRDSWIRTYSDIYTSQQLEKIMSEWHSDEYLLDQITDLKGIFFVAKDRDKIVAICNASLVEGGATINIQKLHVLHNYQRRGIGGNLMKAVEENYPEAVKVQLEVEKKNKKALEYYKHRDFREVDTKVFEVDGIKIPCVVMEKNVNK